MCRLVLMRWFDFLEMYCSCCVSRATGWYRVRAPGGGGGTHSFELSWHAMQPEVEPLCMGWHMPMPRTHRAAPIGDGLTPQGLTRPQGHTKEREQRRGRLALRPPPHKRVLAHFCGSAKTKL